MTRSEKMTSQLYVFLSICSKMWIAIYLIACAFLIIVSPMIHIAVVGLLLCAVSYFRLQPPDPLDSFKILGCDPRNLDGTPSRTRGALGLVAHRCAWLDAPENSIEALRLAKKNGAKCIECDILMTLDGHAVVFHDSDGVERVTDGRGKIEEMTLESVKKLDLAAKHALRDSFSPCRIPTLEEFVDECLHLDLKIILDVKVLRSVEDTTDIILNLYRKNPRLYDLAMTSSFHPNVIYAIRQKDPRIVCSMAWRPGYCAYRNYSPVAKDMVRRFSSPFQHHLALAGDIVYDWMVEEFFWYFLGISAVLIHKDAVTPASVQKWRERGIRVLVWTVNNSLERLYLERHLHVTCLSDTMDEIGLEKVLADCTKVE